MHGREGAGKVIRGVYTGEAACRGTNPYCRGPIRGDRGIESAWHIGNREREQMSRVEQSRADETSQELRKEGKSVERKTLEKRRVKS